jgi:hypothetical protein
MKNKKVNKAYEITLCLADIEHFFSKPDISPFSPYYHKYSYTSGIEYIANDLRACSSSEEILVTILLPDDKFDADLAYRMKDAVTRYCDSRMVELEQQMQGLRKRALHTLPIAIIVLIVFIGLGTQLTNSRFLIVQIIGDGLGIIGWVYVWFPFDAIIFGIQQYRLDKDVYKQLMRMQVTIKCA